MKYKIWNCQLLPPEILASVDKDAPPLFDLELLGFPKLIVTKYGLKQSAIFYGSSSEDRYVNPVCRVIWKTIFVDSVPKYQQRKVEWALVGGGWSNSYQSSQPIRNPKLFLQKMRSRTIEELLELATRFGFADRLRSLYEAHTTKIYIYIEGGSPKFKEAIEQSNEEWLTKPSTDGRTVKDVIVDYLSIGIEEVEVEAS